MVHRRSIDGQAVTFGNQGDLFGNAMTWFDHQTGSVWSQPLGRAILGPMTGTELDLLPSTLVTWGEWLQEHPQTRALDAPGSPTYFSLAQMDIAVTYGDDARAYRIATHPGVVNDVVANIPIAVIVDPSGPESWKVLSRTLDDSVVVELAFDDDGNLVDRLSGTTFDPTRGTGITGPYSDQILDPLPAFTVFEKDFATFYPEGTIWQPGS